MTTYRVEWVAAEGKDKVSEFDNVSALIDALASRPFLDISATIGRASIRVSLRDDCLLLNGMHSVSFEEAKSDGFIESAPRRGFNKEIATAMLTLATVFSR